MQLNNRQKNVEVENNDLHTISAVENPAVAVNEDSKDSSSHKDEVTTKVAVSLKTYFPISSLL